MILKPILYESLVSDDEWDDKNNVFKELYDRIYNEIRQGNQYCDNAIGLKFIQNSFKYNTKTIGVIIIKYIIYLVPTKQKWGEIQNKINGDYVNCEADSSTNTIIVRTLFKEYGKDNFKYSLKRDFAHEFHHLYQYNSGFNKTDYSNSLYDKVKIGISSKDNAIRVTSYLLYYTFKHEISAFCVETYQKIMQEYNGKKITLKTVKGECINYQNFLNTINYFDDVLAYNGSEERIEKYFGITIDTINGRINSAIRMYERYFQKIISKFYLKGNNE